MKSSLYDLEEARLEKEIKKRDAKRVLIQLPEGLKTEGPRLAKVAEKVGAQAIVSADPCYGACDLALQDAESLAADLIVHFGHSRMIKAYEDSPIIYIEAKAKLGVKTAVAKALGLLKLWKRIGLVTTIQHVEMLDVVKRQLLKASKDVVVGDVGRFLYPGQVIGCNYGNASVVAEDVDALLFVGGGRFHAIGVGLAAAKPTVVADPYEGRAYSVDSEVRKIIKQRWASIKAGVRSERFGVIIGLKSGQMRLERAMQVRNKLTGAGKETTLLAIREVSPEALREFPSIEAYVNTACPRISLDDANKFQKPLLTANEALVVTGELTWEQLLKKGLFES